VGLRYVKGMLKLLFADEFEALMFYITYFKTDFPLMNYYDHVSLFCIKPWKPYKYMISLDNTDSIDRYKRILFKE